METSKLFELDQVAVRLVRDPAGPLYSDVSLSSPEAVAKFLNEELFADLDREIFVVINLKTNNNFAGVKVLAMDKDDKFEGMYPASFNICSMGTLNESLVNPREVLKTSILQNANAVLLAHNHPSSAHTRDSLSPSQEDITITDRLVQAYALFGIKVFDHIILGPDHGYFSMKEGQMMPYPTLNYAKELSELDFSGRKVAEQIHESRDSVLDQLKDKKANSHESKRKRSTTAR